MAANSQSNWRIPLLGQRQSDAKKISIFSMKVPHIPKVPQTEKTSRLFECAIKGLR